MYQLFHIGIPKSGTTSLQKTLGNDSRIHLSRSGFITGKKWWGAQRPQFPKDKVIVESNETLVSGGFNKMKFEHVVKRLFELNPKAQIVLTIRSQDDALLSMFKYHIKFNYSGTESFDNWLFNTNLGMDYISCCMYGSIVKSLLMYFPKEQIHVLFFETLKEDPESFYKAFYRAVGLPFKKEFLSKKKMNVMTFNANELYTLNKLNAVSTSKKDSEGFKGINPFNGAGQKLKRKLVKQLKFKAPSDFFDITQTTNYNQLRAEFIQSNKELLALGFVTETQLFNYGYPIA